MGMYTELNIAVAVKVDLNTLQVLEGMTGQSEFNGIEPPDPIGVGMLRSDSFYFDHTADSSLVNKKTWEEEDGTQDVYERILNVRCDLKNYRDEIENFLDWVRGFATTRGFIGYMRYEEEEHPTLIYFTNRGVEYRKVNFEQEEDEGDYGR